MDLQLISSTGFTICGLIFLLLVSFSYLKNRTVNTFESKLYIIAIVLAVIASFSEIMLYVSSISIGLEHSITRAIGRANVLFTISGWLLLGGYFLSYCYREYINRNSKFQEAITYIITILIAAIFFSSFNCGIRIIYMEEFNNYILTPDIKIYTYIPTIITTVISAYVFIVTKEKMIRLPLEYSYILGGLIYILNYFSVNQLVCLKLLFNMVIIAISFSTESTSYKLIKTIEESKENAEKASNAQNEFLASMSHEIRTPLTTILGYSSNAIENKNITTNEIIKTAKSINVASYDLYQLVSNISALFELEYRTDLITTKYFNFSTVALELNNSIYSELPPDTDFKFIINENIPSVFNGDRNSLINAIKLLLSNACHTTNFGFIELSISSNTLASNEYMLIINIKNSGEKTISEEYTISFKDYMINESGKVSSADKYLLGVVVAKKYIELMGGKLSVNYSTNDYAECTINIPLEVVNPLRIGHIELVDQRPKDLEEIYKEEEKAKEAAFKAAEVQRRKEEKAKKAEKVVDIAEEVSSEFTEIVSNSKENYSGKKALVIDDYLLNVRLLREKLIEYNIEVDYCDDGKTALRKAKEKDYNLYFIDKLMPEMDGLELFKKLKKEITNKDTKFVLVTEKGEKLEKRKLSASGIKGYLEKPIDDNSLDALLKKFYK